MCFAKMFANYIGRTMKYRNKVVCVVKEYKGLMTDYEENNMPKDLCTEDTLSAKKDIIDQKSNCM